jgi:hypothetical protein
MSQRLFHLVNQNQAKIAGAQTPQGGIDRPQLPLNFVHSPRAPRAVQSLTKQRKDFAIGSSALTRILIEHDVIKGLAKDTGLIAEVDIPSIASAADHDRTATRGYGFDCLDQRDHRIRIVTVVGNDSCTAMV